jgi:UDP-glucose 4-epimerase
MKYLVTGADGFLGRHFLAELTRAHIPTRAMLAPGSPDAPLPGNPEIVRADLLQPASLAKAVAGVTHVIHLAARVHMMNDPAPDPEKAFFDVNVEGTRSLLAAAAAAGASHFLLMSTVKAMGEEEKGVFDETLPPHPSDPYGRSKLAAEQVVFDLGRNHRIHTVVLRLPMVYGPGAKGNVLRLLEAAARSRRLPFGCLMNRRSMVYVGNVVQAALVALVRPESMGQVYLVCDQAPYSTRDVYLTICRAMGKPPLLRRVPVWLLRVVGGVGSAVEFLTRRKMPVDIGVVSRIADDLCFSSDKIRTQLGFIPPVALEEGIARMVEWYQQGCPPTPPVS